jgi:membrane protease YdiL (CAAX protease family)
VKDNSPAPTDQEHTIPQLGLGGILLMFAWPAVWYTLLIYVIGVRLIPQAATTPTWLRLTIIVFGTGAELLAGVLLLRREGRGLDRAWLRERIRWQWPKGRKAWTAAVIIFFLAFALSAAAEPLNRLLTAVPGFAPPQWWGAAANPTVQVTGAADVFPDVGLKGNFLFVVLYFLIGLVFNIFGEEIYYRGYLLPKMRAAFGRWDWVANGVLFTLKHVYQRWLWPGILIGGLAFAFAAGPLSSLPLAMAYHWAGNFLLPMILLVMAAMGIQ